jgi:hypothetical protein
MAPPIGIPDPPTELQSADAVEQCIGRLEQRLAELQKVQSDCDAFLLERIVAIEERVEKNLSKKNSSFLDVEQFDLFGQTGGNNG